MSLMEKKMPLPSFSETFNMPSKILASFKDNPDFGSDDSSNSGIFPNDCSCCWATECLNSRVPSPVWNDTNFRIVSELTGLTSTISESSCMSSSLECEQSEEFEEVNAKKIEDVKTVELIRQKTSEEYSSKWWEQDNEADTRYSSLSTKYNILSTNESLCEQDESSDNSQSCDGIPSRLPLQDETDNKECKANVSDTVIRTDQLQSSRNSSQSRDGRADCNELQKYPCDKNVPIVEESENVVSTLHKICRRDGDGIDLLNDDPNQENKKDASLGTKILKNGKQKLPKSMIKKCRKDVKHVPGYKSDQPSKVKGQFPCDKCQRVYKYKRTLSWHRNKYPDCKQPLSVIIKNKSCTKDSVHSKTLGNVGIHNRLESNISNLVAKKRNTSNVDDLKRHLTRVDKKIGETRGDSENNVKSEFCSVLNETLGSRNKNTCKKLKISAISDDTSSKNFFWQCDLCVKCYKHKSSLQKHKKKYHPLEIIC